ncbi:MAG: hypothetical protein QY328_15270 [Anaerolineales bacterium]|nr:MAG: hypothetical protein QY328_15270 [Anaerolineales bacterium]
MMNALYKDLFRLPAIVDKLSLLRLLLDADEINVNLALALLKVIHKQLSLEQARERSAYKRYAETIEVLRHRKADMLQQVVDAWKAAQVEVPAEWFSTASASDD